MYSHQCAVENYTAEFERLPKYASWKQKMKRCYQLSILMSYHQPQARLYYRTYSAIRAARMQHVNTYKHIIHPFSTFRKYWELVMAIVIFTLLIISPMIISFYHPWMHQLVTMLNFFCIADIVLRFFTGYTVDNLKAVVLTPREIALHYVKSPNFYMEVIPALPFVIVGWVMCAVDQNSAAPAYFPLLIFLKLLRLKSFLEYAGHAFEYCLMVDHWFMFHIKFFLLFVISIHWCGCLLLVLTLYDTLLTKLQPNCVNLLLARKMLNKNDESEWQLYYDSVFYATKRLFCVTSASHKELGNYKSLSIYVITSMIGYLFNCFALVLFVQMMFRRDNTNIRYESVMNQLSKYMRHKQLPMKMQERLVHYYEYFLRKSYSREVTIFTLLSKRIRHEISIHSIAMMVKKVVILKHLPDEVISKIIARMSPEVYLPNDVISSADTEATCMYFIYMGTVAVYSPSGKEICHLEDGAYFGEVGLMMQDGKRVANVIALEITEVYRLDKKHFYQEIRLGCPDLYRKMKTVAERRHENTMVMEEIHRKQLLEETMRVKQEQYIEKY